MKPFKPMLAAPSDGEDLNLLKYPVLATPKYDGIRAIVIDGVVMSRSLKPIPNRYIQSILGGRPELNGLDGELIVGTTFQASTSGIMSEDGTPDFRYYVFDVCGHDVGYSDRLECLKAKLRNAANTEFGLTAFIVAVLPVTINNRAELDLCSANALEEGHEGIMIRRPDGPYKHGRATFNEGYLTKIKPFADAEAVIVGFEERMHNANEAKTNALGRTERSSHKENLVPMGTLGALVCSNQLLWPGQTFNIGTGFDDFTRANIWAKQTEFLGQTVKFKYQAIGTVDKPRIPVFLGMRDGRDQS